MRILLIVALLSFSVTQSAFASDEADVYEVKRGEVWDWHDVLGKSEHYQGWAGIGLHTLVARLNGSPKLKPGVRIRLAPLPELLKGSPIFERWPDAKALLDARTFAKSLDAENPKRTTWYQFSDRTSMQEEARRIHLVLARLRKQAPRRASVQLRGAMDSLKRLAAIPKKGKNWSYKDQMGLHRRIGLALLELHKSL